MLHCRGGDGPDTFDMQKAIEKWVETGDAPGPIVGAHRSGGKIDRTRPICPYPQTAVYKGEGSVDDAVNFACRIP